MSVISEHPEYTNNLAMWKKCRHVCMGEDIVKMQGETYLPSLTKQGGPAYTAYKLRASFYSASERTIDGLVGAVFQKKPEIEPESLKKEKLGKKHENLFLLALQTLNEVNIVGRLGLLVDAKKSENVNSSPYIVLYRAESIINWKYEDSVEGMKLVLLVLKEQYQDETADEFEHKYKDQYRVLRIKDGVYSGEIFRQETGGGWIGQGEYFPKSIGKSMTEIPFTFVNPIDSTQDIYNPPILPVVNVNLSHYRSSADLKNGLHFCGNPIPYAAGFDIKGDEFHVGSEVGYVSTDPGAKIGYGELNGRSLAYIREDMEADEQRMAVLGARMLEQSKKGIEKPEAIRLRQVGEHNSLRQTVNSVSEALTKVLGWWSQWGKKGSEPTIQLNTDFISDKLSPEEQKALVMDWQSGAISWPTMFYNMKKGEMYSEGWTEEQERQAIDDEMSKPTEGQE